MIKKRIVHHANDVTNTYLTNVIPEILHEYFKLPGKFVRNYTTKILKRDGSEGQMDWLILVEPDNCSLFEKILINIEFQSSRVTKEKIKIIAEYKDYAKLYYQLPVLSVIIITDGYEASEREYSRVSSDILKPVYIHMGWDKIIERLNNIEKKISKHEKLSKDDGLDMVFLPMFAPRKEAKWITEKVTCLFSEDSSLKNEFRNHIGYGLSIMIKKYFKHTSKSKELLNMLEPDVTDSRLRIVAEFEANYEREELELELEEKNKVISENEKTISEKNNEIKALKQKLKENGIAY